MARDTKRYISFLYCVKKVPSITIMTYKSPSKQMLLLPIENQYNETCQLTKTSLTNFIHVQKHVGINTEQTQCDRNIGTNPPKYTEELIRAMDNENVANDIAQVLVQGIFS
jgi:hypothetical protein